MKDITKWVIGFIALLCLASYVSYGAVYLLPGRFIIKQINQNPIFSVEPAADGHEVTLVFEADYSDVVQHFYREEEGFQPQIIELPVEAEEITFLGGFISENPAVVSIDKHFFGDQVQLTIRFNQQLTKEQIIELLTFNLIYGNVQAKVTCNQQTRHKFCDKAIVNIPVFNQYRFKIDKQKNSNLILLVILNEYKSHLILGQPIRLVDRESVERYAMKKLFLDDSCRKDLSRYEKMVCKIIVDSSNEKVSLFASIEKLSTAVFDEDLFQHDFSQFIIKSPIVNQPDVPDPNSITAKILTQKLNSIKLASEVDFPWSGLYSVIIGTNIQDQDVKKINSISAELECEDCFHGQLSLDIYGEYEFTIGIHAVIDFQSRDVILEKFEVSNFLPIRRDNPYIVVDIKFVRSELEDIFSDPQSRSTIIRKLRQALE